MSDPYLHCACGHTIYIHGDDGCEHPRCKVGCTNFVECNCPRGSDMGGER